MIGRGRAAEDERQGQACAHSDARAPPDTRIALKADPGRAAAAAVVGPHPCASPRQVRVSQGYGPDGPGARAGATACPSDRTLLRDVCHGAPAVTSSEPDFSTVQWSSCCSGWSDYDRRTTLGAGDSVRDHPIMIPVMWPYCGESDDRLTPTAGPGPGLPGDWGQSVSGSPLLRWTMAR